MPGRLLGFNLPSPRLSSPDPSSATNSSTPTSNPPRRPDIVPPSPMESFRRNPLAAIGKHSRKASLSPSPGSPKHHAGSLDIKIESPPAVFYGNANQSTGAIYAGQVSLNVTEPEITLSSFTMRVLSVTTMRKPVSKDCPDCMTKTAELKGWSFIANSQKYAAGPHSVPFSYLFPGRLPITTWGDLGRIQYYLEVKAVLLPTSQPHSPSSPTGNNTIILRREVHISRALQPIDGKLSIRIFPPTNLTARVTYEPIVHPIGDFNVQMVLNGIVDRSQEDTQSRWRLRKLLWRLDEIEKMVSPACSRHAAKVGGEGKGIAYEDTRTIGRAEIKSGWKTDISDASIAMEFSIRPNPSPRALCDVESTNGLVISHSLVIELIIAEEWALNKTPDKAIPTGAARVLRMQFAMMVTERSGMGISWDEEMPPMYEDVPGSPPIYPRDMDSSSYLRHLAVEETTEMQRTQSQIIDYTGTPLGPPPPFTEEAGAVRGVDEEFEGLALGPSHFAPTGVSPSARPVASSSRAGGAAMPPAIRPESSGSGRRESGQTQQALTPTSLRGRNRLDADDFITEDQERARGEREESGQEGGEPDVGSGQVS